MLRGVHRLRPLLAAPKPVLSVEEALFLAKEAGIYTTRELQTHVIKSPPFSTDDQPFLLENFYESLDQQALPPQRPKAEEEEAATAESDELDFARSAASVPPAIHNLLTGLSAEGLSPERSSFRCGEREWLYRAEGRGTRKRSVAHAVLVRGTGTIKVNGEEDFYRRWPLYYNRMEVLQPLQEVGMCGRYDVFLGVRGGGPSGQSGAARLAIARALVQANPACAEDFRDTLMLFEDTRQTLSKNPGCDKARKRPRWSKR